MASSVQTLRVELSVKSDTTCEMKNIGIFTCSKNIISTVMLHKVTVKTVLLFWGHGLVQRKKQNLLKCTRLVFNLFPSVVSVNANCFSDVFERLLQNSRDMLF